MFAFDLKVVELPLITKFRGIEKREIALFEGPAGWSEFSPFQEYGAKEAAIWLKAAIECATKPPPTKIREAVKINAILPNVEKSQVKNILERFSGCKTIKIKVNNFKTDYELLTEVLSLVPDATVRLDINGQWELNEAIENLNNFYREFKDNIDYVEQPCLDFEDLKSLRKQIKIKIAVDESIRKNLYKNLKLIREIADIAIIKWAPIGGIQSALAFAETINLPIVISSALESSVGISHGLALAQSIPNLYGACGLGSVSLFEFDVTNQPFVINNGKLSNRKITPELIDQIKVEPKRLNWWHNRIDQIYREGLI
jgi:O-succinylbenzoate synthase